MWFWIKHLFLAIVLIGAAAFLLFGENIDLGLNQEPEKPEQGRIYKPSKKTAEEIAKEEESGKGDAFSITTSRAAEGLSGFYGKVKEELLGTSKTMGDGFVLKLEPSVYTVDEQLQRRGDMVQPGPQKFTGEVMTRKFRSGDTLKQILEEATEAEGMELIWRLDRDYVIKHYFQVESDLVGAVGTVARALDSDFDKQIMAFYCYKQRALLITHEVTEFVRASCKEAKRKQKTDANS